MSEYRHKNRRRFLAFPYIFWIVGFTLIPLCVIFRYAFTGQEGGFTFANIRAIADPIHGKALLLSLLLGALCTVICIGISYPLVLALRRLHMDRRGFALFVLILPMWMNFILRLLAWQMILSNNGLLNFFLKMLGLGQVRIANTWVGVLIGVVYEYVPYMILPIFNAISQIDKDILEAAGDLGAGSFTIFRKIIFPLSLPGLFSGIVMVFVPAMTSFVAADVLGGGKLQLIGNVIEQEFMQSANWNVGSGLSVSLMLFVLLSMAFTRREQASEKGGRAIW